MTTPSCERGQWHSGTVVHSTPAFTLHTSDWGSVLRSTADITDEAGLGDSGMTVNTQIASQRESVAVQAMTSSSAERQNPAAAVPTQQEFGNSEDPLSDLQTFLLHAGQRGAGHRFGSACSRETSLLQDKVIVGRGVHGVKNIGVVGNLQLCVGIK